MDDSELSEIVKLAGGPDFDPYKKQRKEAEKSRKANDFGFSPFLIQRATAKQPERQTKRPLYGDLWCTGDLALLVGEPGVGKSLLATQIAEVIARGAKHSINGLPASPKPQSVIYFDFERTQAQFSELYSCQPFPQTPYREEYKFSTRFDHARLDDISDIPDAFNGSVDRYIRHWVFDQITTDGSKVYIIDNISHLAVGTTIEKVMRALRAGSAESRSSVLVVAHAKPKRRQSAVTLADITRCRSLRELPNSIFAIARSMAHPDIRYVKDLKSHTAPLTADIAAALRSEMSAPSPALSEPGAAGIPARASRSGVEVATGPTPAAVLTYRIERLGSPIHKDQPSTINEQPGPFLGLNYLGLSLESRHLPGKPQRSTIDHPRSPLKQLTARQALEKGLMDGSYRGYLLGE